MSYMYMEHLFLMFLDHTRRSTTVGRTPLDEWSARRRNLYLTTHNTHNKQTSMPTVGLEPKISAGERPQIYALDRAATGTVIYQFLSKVNSKLSWSRDQNQKCITGRKYSSTFWSVWSSSYTQEQQPPALAWYEAIIDTVGRAGFLPLCSIKPKLPGKLLCNLHVILNEISLIFLVLIFGFKLRKAGRLLTTNRHG